MKDTLTRRPGRPRKYDEPLERIQLLVLRSQREAAEKEAAKRDVTISEIYREWIDRGRQPRRR